jgi:hypothetical protein
VGIEPAPSWLCEVVLATGLAGGLCTTLARTVFNPTRSNVARQVSTGKKIFGLSPARPGFDPATLRLRIKAKATGLWRRLCSARVASRFDRALRHGALSTEQSSVSSGSFRLQPNSRFLSSRFDLQVTESSMQDGGFEGGPHPALIRGVFGLGDGRSRRGGGARRSS